MTQAFKPLLMKTIWAILSLIVIYALFFKYWDRTLLMDAATHLQGTLSFKLSSLAGMIFKPSHWISLAIVLLAIGFLKGRPGSPVRQELYCIGFSILLANLVALVFKVILARYRPVLFLHEGLYGFHFFSIKHSITSTPSGHASAAFAGLFAFFEACKNRYRWLGILALVLAVLIAISRVIELDHYPSDVIFGAYVGILSVYYVQFFMGKRWQ